MGTRIPAADRPVVIGRRRLPCGCGVAVITLQSRVDKVVRSLALGIGTVVALATRSNDLVVVYA